jgi:hypothetical protein
VVAPEVAAEVSGLLGRLARAVQTPSALKLRKIAEEAHGLCLRQSVAASGVPTIDLVRQLRLAVGSETLGSTLTRVPMISEEK